MPYFILIPVFLLWLIIAGVAILSSRQITLLNGLYPYVLRICSWATVGFLTANAILALLLALSLHLLNASPDYRGGILEILWAFTAIGGPWVASAIGWVAGALLGFFLSQRNGETIHAFT